MKFRPPTLVELPPPPYGKTGWPWTEETSPLREALPGDAPWPRVTVVTPSYNQAAFIEETIRSVLLQGYPDLEYILIDGSSTDGSLEVIRRYDPWLASFVSEADRGQAHAINKGFALASGEVLAWLNSDDYYLPGAIYRVVETLCNRDVDIVWGDTQITDAASAVRRINRRHGYTKDTLRKGIGTLPQPATFWRRRAWESVGELDESLYFCMDYDLWMRMAARPDLSFSGLDHVLSAERVHAGQKTTTHDPGMRSRMYIENAGVFRAHHPSLLEAWGYLLSRRAHLWRRGRGWRGLLLNLEEERAIFQDGAAVPQRHPSPTASRLGFALSYHLLNAYLKATHRLGMV